MKTRIGHLLVRADLVTESQLARALEVQHVTGGRIGTLLLERGALGEDDLGKALALQQGCEYVSWNSLSILPLETLAVLPSRFALKHNAIPYECGEGHVKMALRDPGDLGGLDEVAFVTGRRVFASVAPEVRIYQALEKHYGKLRAPRYAILAERLSRLKKVAAAPRASGQPPAPKFFVDRAATPAVNESPSAPKSPTVPTPGAWTSFLAALPEPERPGESEDIPWDDTTGSRSRPKTENLPPPAPFEEAEAFEFAAFEPAQVEPLQESFPPPPEESFDQVLAATNRDATAGAVLAALVRRFPSAAIFSSHSEGVTGWDAAGKDVNPSALRSFSVSWNEPSVFLTARISRDFYVGPLPSLPRHDQLAVALGGWPGEGIVQPVFIGEKPVAFLYASSPSPGAFSAWDLAFFRRLRDAASTALANAIRLKKGEI